MVQDDVREREMISLFNLQIRDDRSRADIDAHLPFLGQVFDFELKSTTKKSVTTVRDFGPDHIKRWRNGLHWIFAFYDRGGTKLLYCIYASPADMEPWIAEREAYVRSDVMLADSLPGQVDHSIIVKLFGELESYTRAQAHSIMKRQWTLAQYTEHADMPGGKYSLGMMTEILRQRARYIIMRGSTLNNPHIPAKFFKNFDRITTEHAAVLREKVSAYVEMMAGTSTQLGGLPLPNQASASAIDAATA